MLVSKSVPRAVRSKSFFAALSVLLMIAGTLFGANAGQASSTTAVTKQSLKTCVNTVSGSVYLRTGRLCNSKTGTTVKWFRSVKPAAGKTVVTLVSCVNKKTRSTRLARSTRCKSRTEKKVVWSRLVTAPVESEVVGQDPSATEPAAASLPVITSLRQASATTIEVSFSMTSVRTTTRDGGVTTYTVTASTSSGDRSATGTTSPITVTGLTQYTAYTFIVTATGADGSSRSSETSPPVTTPYAPVPTPPTSASPVVTPVTVPGAPTIGVATATGATTATVAFTAPVSDGGSTITTYTATSTPAGGSGTLSSAGSGTITVTGLTTGTSYTFTVTATNSVGTSAASAASAAVIPTLTCAAAVTQLQASLARRAPRSVQAHKTLLKWMRGVPVVLVKKPQTMSLVENQIGSCHLRIWSMRWISTRVQLSTRQRTGLLPAGIGVRVSPLRTKRGARVSSLACRWRRSRQALMRWFVLSGLFDLFILSSIYHFCFSFLVFRSWRCGRKTVVLRGVEVGGVGVWRGPSPFRRAVSRIPALGISPTI
jgi:hypothetical protein